METNKRFLRYNSIAIVAWPIINVWLPTFMLEYKNDTPLFPIERLLPMIINLTLDSIMAALPFIVFASLARLKMKKDKSDLLLKSLAYTFYFVLTVVIISQPILWFNNINTRTANMVNFGLVVLLFIVYFGIIFLMPAINSIIYKILAKKNN